MHYLALDKGLQAEARHFQTNNPGNTGTCTQKFHGQTWSNELNISLTRVDSDANLNAFVREFGDGILRNSIANNQRHGSNLRGMFVAVADGQSRNNLK